MYTLIPLYNKSFGKTRNWDYFSHFSHIFLRLSARHCGKCCYLSHLILSHDTIHPFTDEEVGALKIWRYPVSPGQQAQSWAESHSSQDS